jgi:hypothetical protein
LSPAQAQGLVGCYQEFAVKEIAPAKERIPARGRARQEYEEREGIGSRPANGRESARMKRRHARDGRAVFLLDLFAFDVFALLALRSCASRFEPPPRLENLPALSHF